MGKLVQSLGRESNVYFAISAGATFGTRLYIDSSGFIPTISCNMGESVDHIDRIDQRVSKSVTDKVEGLKRCFWDITTYLATTGTSTVTPEIHNLLLMSFGGASAYASSGSGDLHTYYFSASQTAHPVGFIMQSYERTMQRTMRSAYIKSVTFSLSNGVPKVIFEGGGTYYGVSGGPGDAPVVCGGAGGAADGGGGATGTAYEDINDPEAQESDLVLDSDNSFDEDAVVVTPTSSPGSVQLRGREPRLDISVDDWEDVASFVLFIDNRKYVFTEGVDYTASVDAYTTATAIGNHLDTITGLNVTENGELITIKRESTSNIKKITGYSTAAGLTFTGLSIFPVGGGATVTAGDSIKLFTPTPPATIDNPVSGVVGSVTWTDLEANTSRTDIRLAEFELTIDHATQEYNDAILTNEVVEVSYGWRKVFGTMKFRAAKIWINNFISAKQRKFSDLVIELGNIDGHKVALSLDKVYFTSWEVISPEVEDVMLSLSFEALGGDPATNEQELKLIYR